MTHCGQITEGSSRHGEIVQGQARDAYVRATALEINRECLNPAVLLSLETKGSKATGKSSL